MKNNNNKNRIEHRGYDKTASKNFDLEMKIVKNSYRATHSTEKESDLTKFIK
jgi:hypothetical protein